METETEMGDQAVGGTLILRALHLLHPALDFLWDRRGGIVVV